VTEPQDIFSAVKVALRVTAADDGLDAEISDLIAAAKADLGLSGVELLVDTDPLVRIAIITYCKSRYGFDNPESEKLARSFHSMKLALRCSAKYTVVADEI